MMIEQPKSDATSLAHPHKSASQAGANGTGKFCPLLIALQNPLTFALAKLSSSISLFVFSGGFIDFSSWYFSLKYLEN